MEKVLISGNHTIAEAAIEAQYSLLRRMPHNSPEQHT